MQELQPHVKITVTGDCGHVLGTWTDSIKEKYPFWCEECGEDKRMTKYPWTLTTEVILPAHLRGKQAAAEEIFNAGVRAGREKAAGAS